MSETPTNARIDPDRIRVSNHARLRAMTRLGVVERVAEHIRDLLAKAEPVDVEYVRGAQAYQAGNVTLVVDDGGEVVQTLFEKEAGR